VLIERFMNTVGMKRIFHLIFLALIAQVHSGVAQTRDVLTVFAAASLKGALDEVVAGYPVPVVVSYGGSGMIARQVAQGAPADVVILANRAWMTWLSDQGVVAPKDVQGLLSNRLVLVAPSGAGRIAVPDAATLLSRLAGGRLATGHFLSVPSGIYGKEWMQDIEVWTAMSERLAETENVRAALALVARGEAPLGLVYATDAQAEPGVAVVYDVPADTHTEIVYPMAVIGDKNAPQLSEFRDYLMSEVAMDIFQSHGFLRPGGGS